MGASPHNGRIRGTRNARGRMEAALAALDEEQVFNRVGTSGDTYTIRRNPTVEPGEDRWTCTCKGYTYRSRQKSNYQCKHIREIRECLIQII